MGRWQRMRRQGGRVWRRRRRWSRWAVLLAAVVLSFVWVESRLAPAAETLAYYEGKAMIQQIISQQVQQELERTEDGASPYAGMVRLTRNQEGQVTSLELDALAANRFQSRVTSAVLGELGRMGEQRVSVPLGAVLGSHLFYRLGPPVPLVLEPSGYVESRFENRFSEAGINQTLHQVVLVVQTHITAVLPGQQASAQVESEFILAQTVIAGPVPQFYATGKEGSAVV